MTNTAVDYYYNDKPQPKKSLINWVEFDRRMARLIRSEFTRLADDDPQAGRLAVEELVIKILRAHGMNESMNAYAEVLNGVERWSSSRKKTIGGHRDAGDR